MKIPEIEIDYIKTKRRLKDTITNYQIILMKLYKIRKPIYTKDFRLVLPKDINKNIELEQSKNLKKIVDSFHDEINKLEEIEKLIFIKSMLEKCSDTSIGFLINYSESSIRDKRKEVIETVALILNCEVLKTERGD